MPSLKTIAPCLWFDSDAEAAAKFYTAIFPDSRIVATSYYGEAGKEFHGKPAGSVLTVEFELAGQAFTALNGGPVFKFNEAISLQVLCDTQADIDYFWEKLGAGDDPSAQQCGWLKDKFGVSWQVSPTTFGRIAAEGDRAKMERAMSVIFGMKKLDMAEIERAANG